MRPSHKWDEVEEINQNDDISKMKKKINNLKKKIHEYHDDKIKQDQTIIKLSVENESLKKNQSLNNSEIFFDRSDQELNQKVHGLSDELTRIQERYNYIEDKYEYLSQQYADLTEQNYQLLKQFSQSDDPIYNDEINRILKKKNQEIENLKADISLRQKTRFHPGLLGGIAAKQDNSDCIIMLRHNVHHDAVLDIEFIHTRYQIKVQHITDFKPDLVSGVFCLFFAENGSQYQESFQLQHDILHTFNIIRDFLKENYVQNDQHQKIARCFKIL